jgi:hypothetical protein
MTVKTKSRVSRSHEDATVESCKDPAFAEYLNSILEDGDQEELMLAPPHVQSLWGVQKLAVGEIKCQHLTVRSHQRAIRTKKPESGSKGDECS